MFSPNSLTSGDGIPDELLEDLNKEPRDLSSMLPTMFQTTSFFVVDPEAMLADAETSVPGTEEINESISFQQTSLPLPADSEKQLLAAIDEISPGLSNHVRLILIKPRKLFKDEELKSTFTGTSINEDVAYYKNNVDKIIADHLPTVVKAIVEIIKETLPTFRSKYPNASLIESAEYLTYLEKKFQLVLTEDRAHALEFIYTSFPRKRNAPKNFIAVAMKKKYNKLNMSAHDLETKNAWNGLFGLIENACETQRNKIFKNAKGFANDIALFNHHCRRIQVYQASKSQKTEAGNDKKLHVKTDAKISEKSRKFLQSRVERFNLEFPQSS